MQNVQGLLQQLQYVSKQYYSVSQQVAVYQKQQQVIYTQLFDNSGKIKQEFIPLTFDHLTYFQEETLIIINQPLILYSCGNGDVLFFDTDESGLVSLVYKGISYVLQRRISRSQIFGFDYVNVIACSCTLSVGGDYIFIRQKTTGDFELPVLQYLSHNVDIEIHEEVSIDLSQYFVGDMVYLSPYMFLKINDGYITKCNFSTATCILQTPLQNIVIGHSCANIWLGTNCRNITIADGCWNLVLQGSNQNIVFDYNTQNIAVGESQSNLSIQSRNPVKNVLSDNQYLTMAGSSGELVAGQTYALSDNFIVEEYLQDVNFDGLNVKSAYIDYIFPNMTFNEINLQQRMKNILLEKTLTNFGTIRLVGFFNVNLTINISGNVFLNGELTHDSIIQSANLQIDYLKMAGAEFYRSQNFVSQVNSSFDFGVFVIFDMVINAVVNENFFADAFLDCDF